MYAIREPRASLASCDVLDLLGQRPLFSLLPLFLHLFLRGAQHCVFLLVVTREKGGSIVSWNEHGSTVVETDEFPAFLSVCHEIIVFVFYVPI